MEKGHIIFLNGVTSAGKTSIAEALQRREDVFFYVLSNDMFQKMIGTKHLRENYWKHLGDAIVLMYHTARMFSDLGKNVLIDGMLLETEGLSPHYQQMLEILKDRPLDLIEVSCPSEVCRKRNLLRGDRYETQSEEQRALMAKNIKYTLSVDTSFCCPEECAEIIAKQIFG